MYRAFAFFAFMLASLSLKADPNFKPPLLSLFPQSIYLTHSENSFDRYNFPLAVPKNWEEFSDSVTKEGRLVRAGYELPEQTASALEVMKNYEGALLKNNAEILFSCVDSECVGADDTHLTHVFVHQNSLVVSHEIEKFAYLTAKLSQDGNDFFVGVIAGQFGAYTRYELVVLEEAAMVMDLVSVEQISKALDSQGYIALYGIYFDHNKASIKPESSETLKAIADFMKGHKNKQVYIVGHTDMKGGLDYNLSLSNQRASAVVKVLSTDYGVSLSRMVAKGVGPLSPVATNSNEKGRAKNRRVELVTKQ